MLEYKGYHAFEQCIDNYLDLCEKIGKNADKEFKGTFNVRISPEMHNKVAGDKMWFSNLETMSEILKAYEFTAEKFIEEDGSVTMSLNEIDLIENGMDEQIARLNLGKAILEYSMEYYNEYELYSHTPNRKQHIPYIFRALIMDKLEEIGVCIQCRDGKKY